MDSRAPQRQIQVDFEITQILNEKQIITISCGPRYKIVCITGGKAYSLGWERWERFEGVCDRFLRPSQAKAELYYLMLSLNVLFIALSYTAQPWPEICISIANP